jgi:quercetin dioxygenase-like cupin family protein
MTTSAQPVARLVDPQTQPALDILGATIQLLTPLEGADEAPCVMRGTIAPGVVVPLHSHPDPETFLMLSGRLEGLEMSADGFGWIPVGPGDLFHVPGNAKHAWRNPAQEPAVTLLTTTVKLGRFFGEIGAPIGSATATAWPPSDAAVRKLLETSERYGYWNATPEENAQVGLRLGA